MPERLEGRCLCTAVRFEALGPPKWVLWCHCESCRRHSGASASVFVSYDDNDVRMLSGEIMTYESSPGVKRGFCVRCGSTLTCTNPKLPNETHFHVGAFERAAELAPTGAFFGNECLPWFEGGRGPLAGAKAMAAVVQGRSKRQQT